jgi:ABC-type Fe3+-hydroxamate transport system substrate-binding protein
MMSLLGQLVQKQVVANRIIDDIKSAWQVWTEDRLPGGKTALYLIWANPWMAAARSTFIDTMLDMAGLVNVLDQHKRYPVLELSDLPSIDPDLVLLSSEPYPFKEKHLVELSQLLPNAHIVFVDGEMFSWYGSRLALVPQYFKSLMHEVDQRKK